MQSFPKNILWHCMFPFLCFIFSCMNCMLLLMVKKHDCLKHPLPFIFSFGFKTLHVKKHVFQYFACDFSLFTYEYIYICLLVLPCP